MSAERIIQSPTSTYRLLETLGEGTFGVVVKCQVDNGLAAVKMLKHQNQHHGQEESILQLLSETEQREHFVHLLESFQVEKYHLQVFEYLDTTLLQYIAKTNPTPMREAGPLLFQLLLALKELEMHSIVHADLKPENIMVDGGGNLKIIDFGASHFVNLTKVAPTLCTRWYRAPEIIIGANYGTAMDMWSFGCIAAEMLTGQVLYRGKDELEMVWMMSRNHEFSNGFLDSGSRTPLFFEKKNGIWELDDMFENGKVVAPSPPGVLFENMSTIPCKKTEFTQRRKLGKLIIKVLEVDPISRPTASECIGSDFFDNGNMDQTISYRGSIRRLHGPRTPEGTPPPTPRQARSRSPIISVG